jgi:hypothetical protein
VAGVVVSLMVGGGLVAAVAHRGVGVALDLEPLAGAVREQVRAQAAEALPQFIVQAKQAVPAEVSAQVKGRLGGATLQIADLTLTFPADVLQGLEDRIVGIIEEVVGEILDQMDTAAAADRLAEQAGRMVRDGFGPDLAALDIRVRLLPWLSVPVMFTSK